MFKFVNSSILSTQADPTTLLFDRNGSHAKGIADFQYKSVYYNQCKLEKSYDRMQSHKEYSPTNRISPLLFINGEIVSLYPTKDYFNKSK